MKGISAHSLRRGGDELDKLITLTYDMGDHILVPSPDFVLVPTLRHESDSDNFINHSWMMAKTLDLPKTSRNTNISMLIVHGVVILIKWIFQYNIHTLLTSYEIIIQLISCSKLSKCGILSPLFSLLQLISWIIIS